MTLINMYVGIRVANLGVQEVCLYNRGFEFVVIFEDLRV